MVLYSITTGKHTSKIKKALKNIQIEGFKIELVEKKLGMRKEYDQFQLNLTEGELSFYNYEKTKKVIRETITDMMKSILTAEYPNYGLEDSIRIVKTYLETHHEMHVEGFIMFRLKEQRKVSELDIK